jgi:hypothetical protein
MEIKPYFGRYAVVIGGVVFRTFATREAAEAFAAGMEA